MQLYRQTLKQAVSLAFHSPFLWFFGFFAALAGNGEEYDTFTNNFRLIGNTQINLDTYREAFLDGRIGTFFQNLGTTFGQSALTVLGLILVGLIIVVLFGWIITVSQAAIIRSASQRQDGKPIGFFDAFPAGMRSFWPLFCLNLLAFACIYIPLAILLLPFVTFYVSSPTVSWAVTASIVAFVVLIPINLVVSFIVKYASVFIVVKGSSLPVAVRESWNLFKKHWLVSIELGFLLLIINIVYTLLLASILTMLGLPFTPVGYIIFTVLIVLMGSIFAVFRYSAWTFLFRAILEDRAIPKIVRLFQPKDGLDS